jgi:hypothetical protein
LLPDFKPYYLGLIIVLLSFVLVHSGCYKFEGSQTVPAYLKIDTVLLDTYYPEEGTNSHKITDVWIYVNDGLVGAFELPALIPVLAQGANELEIRPGIKLNGISSTRVPYPFYQPIVFDNFEFVPDSVHELQNLTAEYYPNINFGWMEDFEGSSISLVESATSDTTLDRTEPKNNPEAFLSENSQYSGVISLTEDKPIFGAASFDNYAMPQQGAPVLMELNFKTDNVFVTGLLIWQFGSIQKVPLLVLAKSDDWNKIYINLGPNLSLYPQADDFQVYFEAGLETTKSSAMIYLDNIKLIYR